jgi:hypothetical protein
MDVVINCPDSEVDMQFGLDTLKGTSDVVSLISEAILSGDMPEAGRRTHRSNDVRTKLKHSFRGSFGQSFSIEILKAEYKSRLRHISDDVFMEVVSYFFLEALYLDSGTLSSEANAVLDDIGVASENLTKRLKNPLIEMHKIAKYFDHDIKLHYRRRGHEKKELVKLDQTTSRNITETRTNDDIIIIQAVVVRYHSKTGNGRLHVKRGNHFYSFGLGTSVSAATKAVKRKLSENLHINNLENPEDGVFVNLRVKRVLLPTDEIVRYLVVGLLDET